MADEIGYKLEHVSATEVASEDIDNAFRSSCIDLISAAMGGKVLGFSDQWFADAANLLTPTPPIRQPGKMVYTGAWYDGWETRRHNPAPFDWVVIRLGVASGTVAGVEVDTAFFDGNHAPHISVEGCFQPGGDEEVLSWQGTKGGWQPILSIRECGPSQRFGWKLDDAGGDHDDDDDDDNNNNNNSSSSSSISSIGRSGTAPPPQRYTHVRLNMYPDGGIARFRLFGHAVPVVPAAADVEVDLAAAHNGGVAVACSDQHFGTKDNLLLPGRGRDMRDGWETARSRARGHADWAVVRLGARGCVWRVVVDTAHFRGNYPQRVRVEAIAWARRGARGGGGSSSSSSSREPPADAAGWVEVVGESRMGPDREHEFVSAVADRPFTHVKLVMIPDGGVKRLRVFGRPVV